MQDADSFSAFKFISKSGGSIDHTNLMTESVQEKESIAIARQSAINEGHALGYSNGFADAEKEGYATGLLKGAKEGAKEVEAELNMTLSSLNLALIDVQELALNTQDSIKRTSISIIAEIANKVINKELSLNPEIITSWVEDSIAALPEVPSFVTVTLNNEDYDRIVCLPEFKENNRWKLKANSLIKLGCCEVSTNLADIKINPQEKIQKIVEQIQ